MTPVAIAQARIAAGKRFARRYSDKDRRARKRYLDSSAMQLGSEAVDDSNTRADGDLPLESAEGQTNYLTVNTLVKKDTIVYADPKVHAVTDPPELASFVADEMLARWEKYEFTEDTEAAFLDGERSGHGFIFYFWDEDKNWTCIEAEDSWNVILDPHVTKTKWRQMRYCGRVIKMPREEFLKRYGDKADLLQRDPIAGDEEGYVKQAVEVTLYWDRETEYHFKGSNGTTDPGSYELLYEGENLYGDLPLIHYLGEVNPLSPFRLGSFDLASGQQKMLSDLQDLISNQAKHGGSLTAYNPDTIGEEAKSQFENGRPQGSVPVEGGQFDDAFKVYDGKPVDASLLQVHELVLKGMDATLGSSDYMRGVILNEPQHATSIAVASQQSVPRAARKQKLYEKLCRQIIEVCRRNFLAFGDVKDEKDWQFKQALSSVTKLLVIEGSTAHADPATEQQSSLLLLDKATALLPVMATFFGKIPDIPNLFLKTLRSFNITDAEKFLIDAPDMPQGEEKPPFSTNFKDLAPNQKDVAAQMIGLPPAGNYPAEGGEGDGAEVAAANLESEGIKAETDLQKQAAEHRHEVGMELMKHTHAKELETMKQGHAAQLKAFEAQHQRVMQREAPKPASKGTK